MDEFLDEDGKWKCIRCGACCHFAAYALPAFDRGDGVCKHLTEKNECAIYDTRPMVCRVDTSRPARVLAWACARARGALEQCA